MTPRTSKVLVALAFSTSAVLATWALAGQGPASAPRDSAFFDNNPQARDKTVALCSVEPRSRLNDLDCDAANDSVIRESLRSGRMAEEQ